MSSLVFAMGDILVSFYFLIAHFSIVNGHQFIIRKRDC